MAESPEAEPAAAEPCTTTTTTTSTSSSPVNLSGNWLLDRNDNFEAFLAANGVNWVFRKLASKSKPKMDIGQDGEKFVVTMTTLMKKMEERFTVGEDFEQDAHSGARMKVHPSWDGAKLVMKSEPVKEGEAKGHTITREIIDDELVVTFHLDDIVAKRIFKKTP